MSSERSAASTPESRQRVRDIASTVIAGCALHPRNDYEYRLGTAVVRYLNGLGPGDVPDEYALVTKALT